MVVEICTWDHSWCVVINSDVQIIFLIFLVSFLFFVFVGVREGVEHQAWNWFFIAWCSGPLGFSRVRELFKEKVKTHFFIQVGLFQWKCAKKMNHFRAVSDIILYVLPISLWGLSRMLCTEVIKVTVKIRKIRSTKQPEMLWDSLTLAAELNPWV